MDSPQVFIRDLDVAHVDRVSPDITLQEAARILATTGAGTLVVNTSPLTEFTEHDVVRAIALGSTCDTKLNDVVRPRPGFVHRDAKVPDIAAILLTSGRHSVVIIDGDDEPVGRIDLASITAAMLGGPTWLAALRVALRVERNL
jgi:predicted transcriptional regulator